MTCGVCVCVCAGCTAQHRIAGGRIVNMTCGVCLCACVGACMHACVCVQAILPNVELLEAELLTRLVCVCVCLCVSAGCAAQCRVTGARIVNL